MTEIVNETNIYETFIQQIETVAKELGIEIKIEKEDVRYKNDFYEKNNHIFGAHDTWFEDIKVNLTGWLLHDYGKDDIVTDFTVDEVPFVQELVQDYYDDAELDDEVCYLTLDDVKKELGDDTFNQLLDDIIEKVEEEGFYSVQEHLSTLFNIQCPEEQFNDIEVLSYWTIYFSPRREDDKIARDCGLFPFEYDEEFYLALGGCGMDLSPKLDAYQALTDSSIPKRSQFIQQPDYAKYVVGEEIFNKVMEAIKLDKPVIKIKAY